MKVGYDAVGDSVGDGSVHAVVIAGDAPDGVKGKLERLLTAQSVPYKVVLDGDQLGRAIGRERVVAIAITDDSLGRRVIELAQQLEG